MNYSESKNYQGKTIKYFPTKFKNSRELNVKISQKTNCFKKLFQRGKIRKNGHIFLATILAIFSPATFSSFKVKFKVTKYIFKTADFAVVLRC